MTDICFSGGADGADVAFGRHATAAGHQVIHWTFAAHGRRSRAPAATLQTLNPVDLRAADPHVARANRTLGRSWPPRSEFTANLLRRNWYQVAIASRCYAVAGIDKDGYVAGGTAWAVQMFIDRHGGASCPCYVYCQRQGQWFEWERRWEAILAPPRPEGPYAGVGSRDLQPEGEAAIAALYSITGPSSPSER